MTKQGAITARMTSPDVCVADVNNFSIMERRGRREALLHHITPGVKQGSAAGAKVVALPAHLSEVLGTLRAPLAPITRGPYLFCVAPRPPHLIRVPFVVIRSRCGISSRSGELRRRASVLSGVDWFHPQLHAGLHSPSTSHLCDAINGNSASSSEAPPNLPAGTKRSTLMAANAVDNV